MQTYIFPDQIIINPVCLSDKSTLNRIENTMNKIKNIASRNNIEYNPKIIEMDENKINTLYIETDYSLNEKTFIFNHFKGEFVKKCPGTLHYLCCNYFVISLYVNCPLGCHYCFLQFYLKNPLITFYFNLNKIFSELEEKITKWNIKRIGTGELSDSLLYDPYTEFSKDFVNYFSKYENTYFEFKTKTLNTDLFYTFKPQKNIVVSFSLNSEKMISEEEEKTPPAKLRIEEAAKLAKYGYSIGFHFDPIFYYENWEKGYKPILEMISDLLEPSAVAWISLGTFRYHPDMKEILRANYPDENITKKEVSLGLDNKLRYFTDVREEIYRFFFEFFREKFPVPVYMCMESEKIWHNVFSNKPNNIDNLKNIFNIKKGNQL